MGDGMRAMDHQSRAQQPGESSLAWLRRNRGRDGYAEAMERVEQWLGQVPLNAKDNLKRRLESCNNIEFEGAMLELYLHTLFRSLPQAPEIDLEPTLRSGSCPDMRFRWRQHDYSVLVEATVYRPFRKAEDESFRVRDMVERAGEHVTVTGFKVRIVEYVPGSNEPGLKRLGALITEFLRGVDRGEFSKRVEEVGFNEAMHEASQWIEDEKSGWKFHLGPVLCEQQNQNPSSFVCRWGYSDQGAGPKSLRDKINEKRRQHRCANEPLVVAVCSNEPPDDFDEVIMQMALYGDQGCIFPLHPEREDVTEYQAHNGLWTRTDYPADRVWGVIQTSMCLPWKLPNDHMRLWIHPEKRLNDVIPGWPFDVVKADPDTGRLVSRQGRMTVRELL